MQPSEEDTNFINHFASTSQETPDTRRQSTHSLSSPLIPPTQPKLITTTIPDPTPDSINIPISKSPSSPAHAYSTQWFLPWLLFFYLTLNTFNSFFGSLSTAILAGYLESSEYSVKVLLWSGNIVVGVTGWWALYSMLFDSVKVSLTQATTFSFIGCLLRYLSHLMPSAQSRYTVYYIGQLLVYLAQAYVLLLVVRISGNSPNKSRSLKLIMTGFPLGYILAMGLPLIAIQQPSDMNNLTLTSLLFHVILFAAVYFVHPSRAIPPGSFIKVLKDRFRYIGNITATVGLSLILGAYLAFIMCLEAIVELYWFHWWESGIFSACLLLTSLIFSYFSLLIPSVKLFNRILPIISLPGFVLFTVYLHPSNLTMLAVSCGVIGLTWPTVMALISRVENVVGYVTLLLGYLMGFIIACVLESVSVASANADSGRNGENVWSLSIGSYPLVGMICCGVVAVGIVLVVVARFKNEEVNQIAAPERNLRPETEQLDVPSRGGKKRESNVGLLYGGANLEKARHSSESLHEFADNIVGSTDSVGDQPHVRKLKRKENSERRGSL
ncbi:hypothetical protein BKA69DRAFT_1075541 [Paraphysoderma sedebokerense]|nr:hypothetical protein BKA69DRAFT_1075541 [Paraphysoderma sedebokerense]